jgi:hypothetical protein
MIEMLLKTKDVWQNICEVVVEKVKEWAFWGAFHDSPQKRRELKLKRYMVKL